MKSTHDYRGEHAASVRRYLRARNRWLCGRGKLDDVTRTHRDMLAFGEHFRAQLNTPKRKTSKRARRRAQAYLAELARLIEQNRLMGPFPVRLHVRDASELPAARAASPDGDIGLLSFHRARGIPVVVVPELAPGDGFVEYSDGSLQKVRLGSGATT